MRVGAGNASAGGDSGAAKISADGRHVVICTNAPELIVERGGHDSRIADGFQIVRVDTADGSMRQISMPRRSGGSCGEIQPAVSASGTTIAWTSDVPGNHGRRFAAAQIFVAELMPFASN